MWKGLVQIHKLKYRAQDQELSFEDVSFTPLPTPSPIASSEPPEPPTDLSVFTLPSSIVYKNDIELEKIIKSIISAIKEKVIPYVLLEKRLEQFELKIGENTYNGVLSYEVGEVLDDESYRVSLTNPFLRTQNHRDYYIYLRYNGESIENKELTLDENVKIVSNFFEKYALKTKLGYVWFKKVDTVGNDTKENVNLSMIVTSLINEGLVEYDVVNILISNEKKRLLGMEHFTSGEHYIKVNNNTYELY